jgi:hypothetical protein
VTVSRCWVPAFALLQQQVTMPVNTMARYVERLLQGSATVL